MSKCKLEPNNFIPCQTMKLVMSGKAWNSKAKGFYVSQLINFKTLEERVSGVAFRFSKTEPPVYLNCCPFCTAMLDSQHELPKAAVGGDRDA